MILYPLTAFRVMMKSAESAYRTLRAAGDQKDLLAAMQTRKELYEYLDYHRHEEFMDSRLAGSARR